MLRINLLALVIVCSSCGTETGNPIAELNSGHQEISTNELLNKICQKLNNCYTDLDIEVCKTNVKGLKNIDTALGVDDGVYKTFEDLINAEKNEEISSNKTEFSQCFSDLADLRCDDTELIDAYDENSPADFSNVYKILPVGAGSCEDSFN